MCGRRSGGAPEHQGGYGMEVVAWSVLSDETTKAKRVHWVFNVRLTDEVHVVDAFLFKIIFFPFLILILVFGMWEPSLTKIFITGGRSNTARGAEFLPD